MKRPCKIAETHGTIENKYARHYTYHGEHKQHKVPAATLSTVCKLLSWQRCIPILPSWSLPHLCLCRLREVSSWGNLGSIPAANCFLLLIIGRERPRMIRLRRPRRDRF